MSKIDELRKVDFKNHELRKAYDYKTKFRDLSSAEQQKKLKEHLEKARKHPKINHPVSRIIFIFKAVLPLQWNYGALITSMMYKCLASRVHALTM